MAAMHANARPALAAVLSLSLAACAGSSADYPSLAIRDSERSEGTFGSPEPKRLDIPPVEVDLTGGLDARLASLVADARNAHEAFEETRPRAEELVAAASGTSLGSDRWAAAQVALAELDSARSRAAVPLGDLDAIYTAARVGADDITAIESARNEVIALVRIEDAVLADLRGRVE
ncbi:hypothetical protein K3163_05030 [Qipengyuania sp. 1NDW9]|uniref:hypothetical protein n=1 Tax=Qipengyuania xiapuensis TaxID=2867236 RepID=UPI001C8885B6|nr:hypothetical protein [Qipengyuania xiapuensis]MBX7492568.1 hypothetical protein [Qipengyuania xiapuensis]